MIRRLRGEGGITLPELLVMVSILGVVVTATYAGLRVIVQARDVSDRQAIYSSEVATPLYHLEKILSQAITVEQPAGNRVAVLVDPNNDGVMERHVFYASGGQLVEEIWATDSDLNNVNTTKLSDNVWSYYNSNPGNTDLFTYRDAENRTITRLSGETDEQLAARISNDAKSVRVKVLVFYDDRSVSDARTVFMRNR